MGIPLPAAMVGVLRFNGICEKRTSKEKLLTGDLVQKRIEWGKV
jgi:hypothetical protein